MVDIGGYTGRQISQDACPICGETDDCALNDPTIKMLPSNAQVEKYKREEIQKKLNLGTNY